MPDAPAVRLRPLAAADVSAAEQLWANRFGGAPDTRRKWMEAALAPAHSAAGMVAVTPDDTVVGVSFLEVGSRDYARQYLGVERLDVDVALAARNGLFHLTCVRADWEGQGIGTAFYERRLERLSDRGIRRRVAPPDPARQPNSVRKARVYATGHRRALLRPHRQPSPLPGLRRSLHVYGLPLRTLSLSLRPHRARRAGFSLRAVPSPRRRALCDGRGLPLRFLLLIFIPSRRRSCRRPHRFPRADRPRPLHAGRAIEGLRTGARSLQSWVDARTMRERA